jgi:hypothetical protein
MGEDEEETEEEGEQIRLSKRQKVERGRAGKCVFSAERRRRRWRRKEKEE